MFDQDWKEKKYDEVFEFICRNVKRQQDSDPDFCFEHVRARLNDAYARQGQGWAGTDPVMDITESATISAYEYILAEWQE